MVISAGGELELTLLSGSEVLFIAEGDDGLSVSDGPLKGDFFKPNNLRGVDG